MPSLVLLLAGVTKAYDAFTSISKNFGFAKGTRRSHRGRKKPPMKNFLALIGGAVLILGGAGYYLNWFSIGNIQSGNGQHKLQIDVDSNKIKDDLKKGTDKIKNTLDRLGDDDKPATNDPSLNKVKEGVSLLKDEVKDTKIKTEDNWRKAGNSIFK